MGGGTTIVEAVSQGRRAVGVDLNPISRLVTGAKTVSLSSNERGRIAEWARQLSSAIGAENSHIDCKTEERLRNLPESVQSWFRYARASTGALRTSKERRLARCILLQWGQGLLERASFQDGRQAGERLKRVANECLLAVDAFTQQATKVGLSRRALTGRRALYCSSAETFPFADNPGTVKLVVTSPPYPGVHVVYHRWQILGRKETPAPYYLASRRDGHGESYYTLGGRHLKGLESYFDKIQTVFMNLRPVLADGALVFQILGFSSPATQMPMYLTAMEKAGYCEVSLNANGSPKAVSREVPHRKWYAINNPDASGQEFLFCHTVA